MKKRTNEEFLLEISKLNPTYTILSKYVNCDTNVRCFCNIHHIDFYSTPYNLLKGKCGCELCRREKIRSKNRQTIDEFTDKLKQANPNIEIVGKYINCKTKVECKCKIHNEIFFETPEHLLRGETGCQRCIKIKNHISRLKPHEVFIEEIRNIHPTINVIGIYDGAQSKIHVECLNCGHIWSPKATSLLSGFGCPECSSSKGEKRIKNFLESYNIMFEPQKTFKGLVGVGGKHLSYDFYLPTFNLLIEYQGQFHDGTASFQTEEEFLVQKEHDKRKLVYTQLNNISFLEVWYYDYDDIENILTNTLNNLETP